MAEYELRPDYAAILPRDLYLVGKACDAWFRKRELAEGRERFSPYKGWTMGMAVSADVAQAQARPKMTEAERIERKRQQRRRYKQKARKRYADMTEAERAARKAQSQRWKEKNREKYNQRMRDLERRKRAAMTPEQLRALYDRQAENRRQRKLREAQNG